MRLGFNWPLGPLELTELIGAGRAVALLEELRGRARRGLPPRPGPGRLRPKPETLLGLLDEADPAII